MQAKAKPTTATTSATMPRTEGPDGSGAGSGRDGGTAYGCVAYWSASAAAAYGVVAAWSAGVAG